MTRTELRFITRGIKRAAAQLANAPVAVIEKFMIDAVKIAVEDAADEERGDIGSEVGVVQAGQAIPQPVMATIGSAGMGPIRQTGFDQAPISQPDEDPVTMPKTPMLPIEGDAPAPKSLLLIPGQEGFASAAAGKKLVGTDIPLRVWRTPTKKLKQGAYERRWMQAVSDLIKLVNENMPVATSVTPIGASMPITISRLNTLSDVPSGLVKVEYGLLGQSHAQPSERNTGGQQLEKMAIDRVVTETFSIEDMTVNWEQRVSDVVSRCEDVFRPRMSRIENQTPARAGTVDMLISGDPRKNAGGYGDVGDKNVDPSSESGGTLILNVGDNSQQQRQANRGPIVPRL